MSQINQLMARTIGGSSNNVRAHIRRLEIISNMIGNGNPWQWRCNQLRFVLTEKSKKSLATTYDYWLSIRRITTLMDKWKDWEPHLRGPWSTDIKQKKGRPAKLPYKPLAAQLKIKG